MSDRPLLMIPGPVSINPDIIQAMTKPMISHRSPEFETVYEDCQEGLARAMGTTNELLYFNGSGSAAMEAAVSNTVSKGDTVVSLSNGKFGQKFNRILSRYTDDIKSVDSEWGTPLSLKELDTIMSDEVTAVTMVHTDTAAGLTNSIEAVAKVVEDYDALLIVDCITSVACEEVRVDEWGVDLAVFASQKGLGAPPGLSALTVSERALERLDSDSAPLYLDIEEHREKALIHQTPATSSVQVFWGVQEALRLAGEEGFDRRIQRFDRLSRAVRIGIEEMGLSAYAETAPHAKYANAVTVIKTPDGVHPDAIVSGMADRDVHIRAGLGSLADETIRIGTMGPTGSAEVRRTLTALQEVLQDLDAIAGDGVSAADRILTKMA